MGFNVIDLISSSPPRASLTDHPPAAATKPKAGTHSIKYRGVEFGSDDFRSSDEDGVTNLTALENERSVKRPRLSGRAAAAPSTCSHDQPRPSASRAQPLQSMHINATQSARKVPDDSIEWISSVEADPAYASPLPLPRNTSLTRSITEPIPPHSSLIPDSDPFASSPPPLPQHRPPAATIAHTKLAQDILSDPFASSSPVRVPARPSHTASTTTTTTTATTTATIAREPPTRRPKPTAAAWDPISSSAPCSSAPQTTNNSNNNSVQHIRRPSNISIGDTSADEDDLPAIESFDLSQTLPAYHEYLRKSSAAGRKFKSTTTTTTTTTNTQKRKVSQPNQSSNGTSTGRPKQTVDPNERATAKAQQQEQRRQEREREKENRQRQRDVAAAIVEVNRAKGNKKVSTKEMVVDIPTSLPPTVKVQLETLLDGLEVQHNDYDCGPVPNVVKWKRKINSQFDDESGQWVPMPLRVEKEQHALVVMTAEDMLQLAVDEDGLDDHMRRLRRQCPDEKLIYVLEGVVAWSRKNRNLRNRQYMAGVRSQTDLGQQQQQHQQEQQPSSTQRRRRANNSNEQQAAPVDDDVMEDAILRLQIEHDVLIHHTAIPLETAQWISIFTQNISTIPYKKQKDEETAGARFCMDSGQVKTGDSAQDTYVRMLQEIFRVTAPIAYGVAAEFATVTRLVEGLQERGPNALEQVRKSANKDGAYSDRTVGQAVSKRLYKIFTGTDETSTDV